MASVLIPASVAGAGRWAQPTYPRGVDGDPGVRLTRRGALVLGGLGLAGAVGVAPACARSAVPVRWPSG